MIWTIFQMAAKWFVLNIALKIKVINLRHFDNNWCSTFPVIRSNLGAFLVLIFSLIVYFFGFKFFLAEIHLKWCFEAVFNCVFARGYFYMTGKLHIDVQGVFRSSLYNYIRQQLLRCIKVQIILGCTLKNCRTNDQVRSQESS